MRPKHGVKFKKSNAFTFCVDKWRIELEIDAFYGSKFAAYLVVRQVCKIDNGVAAVIENQRPKRIDCLGFGPFSYDELAFSCEAVDFGCIDIGVILGLKNKF